MTNPSAHARHIRCEKCGYDLRATRDGTCTECGHRSEKVREMAELAGGDLQRFRREGDPD